MQREWMNPMRPGPENTIGRQEFDAIRQLLHARTGIVLDPGKEYFVELRLGALAIEEGFGTVAQLIEAYHTEEPWGVLHRRVVETLAITETSFFRDLHPFEELRRSVLPELMARRAGERRLDLWCAACSSGQEPYSLAMMMRDHFPMLGTWKVNLLATDFSNAMLRRCREGLYSQIEVNRGLPATSLVRHFSKDGLEWRLRESVRQMVQFKELNLIQPWPALPAMDIVFMRNVLIYFDGEARRQVLRNLLKVLKPDGWLFLGGGETTLVLDETFEAVQLGRVVAYRARIASAA